MYQDYGQPASSFRIWLPVTMTHHAAAVRRIHNDCFCNGLAVKSGPSKIIADYCLQVSISQPAARHEWPQTCLQQNCCMIETVLIGGVRAHWSAIGGLVGNEGFKCLLFLSVPETRLPKMR